jgi:glycosyltransferase involved in cell wall biosynthesis
MSTAPEVDASVVVPVFNEASVLRDTAATMLGQKFDGRLEFVFVDGGSDDGSREILAELAARDPRVRVLENPARVEPAALNLGIANAHGTYIALLNAHCWFPPDYLARGIQRLQDGDATWVTGPAIPRGHDPFSRAVARALVSPLGAGGSKKWRAEDAAQEAEVELDTGLFAGVVRRDALKSLGPFEEEWVVNHDSEMAGRVLDSGGRIVQLSRMGAYYHPRSSPRALFRQYWRFGLFRVRTSQRHPVALRPFHLAAAALALSPAAALLTPRPIRRLARLALTTYSLLLARAAVAADPDGTPAQKAAVGAALGTMHFGWGAGFLAGCARFGIPLRASAALLKRLVIRA